MSDTPPSLLDAELVALLTARLAAEALSPADEAIAIRELVRETRAPAALIVRLWRELAGAQRHASGAPPVTLHSARTPVRTLDLARARFGAVGRYQRVEKAEAALAAAKAPGGLAVIALDPQDAWWLRMLAEPDLKVISALPDLAGAGPRSALAVARAETGPTGGDETYFVTDAPGPARTVINAIQNAGFVADLIQETHGLKLLALAGYVQAEDPRLDAAPGRLKGVIGASPLPFDLQT